MTEIVLNKAETDVLVCLSIDTDTWAERCIGFDWIMEETKLSKKEVRNACEVLRIKELICFHRGLMTEDGEVAGSGYCISQLGLDFINENEL